jgi:hypothetical protein
MCNTPLPAHWLVHRQGVCIILTILSPLQYKTEKMKNRIIIFAGIILSLAGCKAIDEWTHFYIPYTERITIPSGIVVNVPLNIQTPDITTNSKSTFEVNNTNADLVEEIKLISMSINHVLPENDDFSFIKAVHVFISADGMAETEIAWKDNIPDTIGKTINLEVSNSDLKEYIIKDNIALRVSTTTDEIITVDHQVDVYSVFFVDAKILGQ